MDMATTFQDQLVFHLTGRRQGDGAVPVDGLGLRPALMAGFRDLTELRYDFPVVLAEGAPEEHCVTSLSSIVDEVLRRVAPRGIDGERLRRHGLQLEREIRVLLAEGAGAPLTALWAQAAARLGAREGETLEKVLEHTGGALKVDGEVLDCTHAMPAKLVEHAWRTRQAQKARRFHAELGRLIVRLSDILRAAFYHSEAGRRPTSLKNSVAGSFEQQFDFDLMSRMLGKGAPKDELPLSRRRRIERTLAVLESQRFYPPSHGEPDPATPPLEFRFDTCTAAQQAWVARLPEVVELLKAIAIAELEIDSRYDESKDDATFESFDAGNLSADDFALLPDYLVCLDPGHTGSEHSAAVIELLASGLPVKVLVQTEDVMEEAALGTGHFAFGVRAAQLASSAAGLNDVFVMQTASSNLVQLQARLHAGLAYQGPALFSVFTGSAVSASTLPPYLTAAAAMQSRAFPAFTYDPAAGESLAQRYSLEDNPQPEADWPADALEYVDDAQQRVREPVAFTLADFALCDARCARHFALVPRTLWNDAMVPAADWLALDAQAAADKVPYVLAVDRDDVLQRVIVDAKLMQSARRCREMWHRRQELGGVHNSHAERLLAQQKALWEAEKQRELDALRQAGAGAAAAAGPCAAPGAAPAGTAAGAASDAAATLAEAEAEPAAPARDPDVAWIETSRCPSCNECQKINDKMFRYNENKQAYVADVTAGTYRQMIEAAESCQVGIIHPGKPWNPKEAGLEELVERAKPFL
jgi:ferredoxin